MAPVRKFSLANANRSNVSPGNGCSGRVSIARGAWIVDAERPDRRSHAEHTELGNEEGLENPLTGRVKAD